jgi:hypothetical protein
MKLAGRWLKSRRGAYARVTRVRDRSTDGQHQYRLEFHAPDHKPLRGNRVWRESELLELKVRWLARKPRQMRRGKVYGARTEA